MSDEDLWARLTEVTGRERIDVLIELGQRASARQDLDRARTLWQEAEDDSLELGDVVLAAHAARMQGTAAFFARDYDAATQLYERAAGAFNDAGAGRDAAHALWCLADTYRQMGDHERQLAAAQNSRALAEVEDADSLTGGACLLQAKALYWLDRDREALEACTAARDYYRGAGLPARVAEVDDFALGVHLWLCEFDEALELARGCLVLARMSSSDTGDAYARFRLAEVLRARGDIDEALEQAERAMAAYRQAEDFVGVGRCAQLRAEAFADRDDPFRALDSFGDARVIFDATGRDDEALRCQVRTAMLLHYVGDCGRATRLNERLIEAYAGLGHHEAMRWSVVRLLDNLLEQGLHEQCLAVAQEHESAWPDDQPDDTPSRREFLGLYAIALERNGRIAQATAFANHVIANTPAREASIGTAYCYEVRGRSRLADDESSASQDFSHAIALHLARGQVDRARELSRYFLQIDREGLSEAVRRDGRDPDSGSEHG